jgi:tetratricopeptide (TPR) repeat protein
VTGDLPRTKIFQGSNPPGTKGTIMRRTRRVLTVFSVLALATGLTLGSAIAFGGPDAGSAPGDPVPAGAGGPYGSSGSFGSYGVAAAGGPAGGSGGALSRRVGDIQAHLRAQPRDAAGWAALGLAYVEQARVTADPSYYPKAEGVLARSLRIRPAAGNDAALTGQAALAAARHDFAAALRLADRALKINPYGSHALAVRVDALVELGRYDEAADAAHRADETRPGIPTFTRMAYVLELRGEPDNAEDVLKRARDVAFDAADVAYVATQRAELAWTSGDTETASRHFADALRAQPSYVPALDGRARVRAADGDSAGAAEDLTNIVRRLPLPSYAMGLGELLEARGEHGRAKEQYAIVRTWTALARANGVATDLETALFDADHGDRAAALRSARAEWGRRHAVHVADALAWALHVNGHDREALTYAERATATGYRNALFRYHRGMIEQSLGMRAAARRSLTSALELNPDFSPVHAPRARAALAGRRGES